MAQTFTAEQVRAKLESMRQDRGWVNTASDLGISARYLRDIVRGDREPTNTALAALGLERVVTYRKIA